MRRGVLSAAFVVFAGLHVSAQDEARTTADGVYTLAQARRGAAHLQRCEPCHGPGLEGSLAPQLIGPVHLERWAGRSLGELFTRIQINFGSLPRQTRDDLTPVAQRAADFTAFLLMQNGFRAGRTELSPAVSQLGHISIVSPPPPDLTPKGLWGTAP